MGDEVEYQQTNLPVLHVHGSGTRQKSFNHIGL